MLIRNAARRLEVVNDKYYEKDQIDFLLGYSGFVAVFIL